MSFRALPYSQSIVWFICVDTTTWYYLVVETYRSKYKHTVDCSCHYQLFQSGVHWTPYVIHRLKQLVCVCDVLKIAFISYIICYYQIATGAYYFPTLNITGNCILFIYSASAFVCVFLCTVSKRAQIERKSNKQLFQLFTSCYIHNTYLHIRTNKNVRYSDSIFISNHFYVILSSI